MPRNWPPSGFAVRLRELRDKAGLSQKALADLVGIHYMTVVKMESAVQEPAWPLVLALAKALGVSVEAFVNGGEPEARPRGRPRKVESPPEPSAPKKRGRPRKQPE